MTEDHLTDLDKIVIEGDQLKVWKDRMGHSIRKLYGQGIVDRYTAAFMKNRVNRAKRKRAFGGIPFWEPELYHGDFFFGRSFEGKIITIPTQWLNGHVLQICGTGSGKTNASKVRAIHIASKVDSCFLVDLRKTEYRALLPIFNELGIDLKIVRGRKFKINPLSVPLHVEPIDYASVISECLTRVLNLAPRSATLLKTTIIKLYAEKGVLNGSNQSPTLFDLHDAVKNNRDANSQARLAVTDNLYALLISLGPEVLGYSKGWDVHELARQHLVIELSGLCEAGKDLILSYLLTAEFISRIARGVSNCPLNLWCAFDEANRLFSAKKESAGYGGNPLIDLLGLVRGCGVGLEISVLSTVDMSPSLVNLTATKVIGRLGSISEYTTAGHFVGLNPEQISWAAHHLVPGTFIGQVGEGNFRYPFVFRMPLVKDLQLESDSDTDADKSARNIVNHKIIKSKTMAMNKTTITNSQADASLDRLITGEVIKAPNYDHLCDTYLMGNSRMGNHIATGNNLPHKLSDSEIKLLGAIVKSPMQPSTEYIKLARISPNTLSKIRDSLLEQDYIKEHLVSNTRGRPAKVWEPTEKTIEIIGKIEG